jgi:hypothetical protein
MEKGKGETAEGKRNGNPKFICGAHERGRRYLPSVLSYPPRNTKFICFASILKIKIPKKIYLAFIFPPDFPATIDDHQQLISSDCLGLQLDIAFNKYVLKLWLI